jgi:hypothetical protein
MKKLSIILLLTIAFLANSCKEGSVYPSLPGGGDTQKEPDWQKSKEYFPNSLGDFWKYEVKTFLGIIDTIKVEIVDKTVLDDGTPVMIWRQYSNNMIDSLDYFYTVDDDTVRSYSDTSRNYKIGREGFYIYSNELEIPLDTGKIWMTSIKSDVLTYYGDTCRVTNKIELIVPLGIIKDVFEITRVPDINAMMSIFQTNRLYFKPYVGFISMDFFDYYKSQQVSWRLITYKVQ